ncbi:MAG: 3',5'-nucleoside bisphosphate phosphatase [Burkholderiales bacterium]
MNIDLHCHSTASDGLLAPDALAARAADNGVTVLAVTDHDEIAGLAQAREAAEARGICFVDGVEISVNWGGITIHVVGLQIDPRHAALSAGLETVRSSRARRAGKMGEALDAAGIPGSFAGALAFVGNPNVISRTHFARFLVQHGYARDVRSVFQHYLVKGKPGYAPHEWAALADAVSWIRASGGVAVIAHPGRYKLSPHEMRALLSEFRDCGGAGIEVVTGSHAPEQYGVFARLAREFGLLASRGSDFHGAGESRAELGSLPPLPQDLKPVWHDW